MKRKRVFMNDCLYRIDGDRDPVCAYDGVTYERPCFRESWMPALMFKGKICKLYKESKPCKSDGNTTSEEGSDDSV